MAECGSGNLSSSGIESGIPFKISHDRLSLSYLSDVAVGGGGAGGADAALSGLQDDAACAGAGGGFGGGAGGSGGEIGGAADASVVDAAVCRKAVWV